MESEESAQPLGKPICLTCPYCQHIYTDQSRRHYEMHVRLCQTEKPYNCSICGTGFSNQNTLRRHQKLHTGGSTEECSVCGKVVSTKFVLKKHMAIHEPREMREKTRYKCSQCDKSFLFKPSLNKHYKIHTGNAVYKCEGCLLTFSSYSKKYHHCRNCAKYICKKTDKSEQFTENSDSLISTVRHKVFSKTNCQKESKNVDEKMLPQKDKPFNCDDCGAQYSSHITLKRHQKQHSGTTGEACPVCGKVLSTKFVMKQHMAVHEPAATREKTRFQCSQCDKSFLFKPSLSRHLKTHTDDASCQCAGCKLVFDSYSSLYRHSKNCEKYIAGISRSSNRCKYSPDIRNVHENSPDENTNDTERGNLRNDTNNHILHKCQICEKSFSIRNMLSKHVDTVHDVFAMQNDTDLEFTEACVAGELLADNEKLSTPEKSNANGEVVSPVSDENILEIRGKLHTQSHAIPIRVVQKEKNKDRQLITLADETENGKQSVGTKNKSEVKLNIDKDIMKCAQSIKQESMLNTVDTTGNSEIFHCRKSKRRIKVKAEKDYHYDLPYIRRVIENHIEAGPGNDSTNLGQDEEYQPEMEIAFLSERPVDEHCKKRNYLSERSSLAVSIEIGQSIKTVDTTGKNEHNENNKNKKYIQLHKKKIFRKNVQKEKILTKSVENKSKNKEKQNRNENKINTSSSVNNNSSEFEYTKMEPGSETHIDSTLINNMVICRYCTFSGDSIHGLKDHLRVAHKELETNDEVQKDYAVVNEIGHVNQYLYPCKVCFEFLPNLDDLIKHNAEIHCESSETSRANSGCRKKHVTEMRSVSEEVNSVHTPINKEVKKEGKKKTNKGVKKKKNKAESSAAASDEGMRIEGSKDVSVQYRCTAPGCKCTTQFKWKKTLERHKQEEHHEKLLHVCGICDSQYAEAHVYKSHLRLAHSETQYVQLKLLDTLILENETIDGTEKSTKRFHVDVCTACGETFVSTKPGSYQHECIPKDIRYYCPYCKHIGDDFSAVKEHISELHPDLQKTKENGGQYQNLEFQHVIPETRSKTFQSDSERAKFPAMELSLYDRHA